MFMIIPESGIRTAVIGSKNTQQFGVSDNKVIFDILRNKLYVNPINAICREISSNCRDANREAGFPDKPIEISIERDFTNLGIAGDAAISFKDSGIGIDPTRMSDVFLKYGESSKRNSNDFTGGFGLGAKTPFAYSDSFSIKTICNYNGKRIKYFYVAAIDKEEKGTMYLFREEETAEDTGTIITIPLKREDISKFEYGCIDILRGWNPKPIFNNFSINFTSVEKKIPFDGFEVWIEPNNHLERIQILIDEIPYSVLVDSYYKVAGAQIVIPFKNGELELSGSREKIQDKKENHQIINKRLQSIQKISKKWLDDYVSKESSQIKKNYIYWKLYNKRLEINNENDKIANLFSHGVKQILNQEELSCNLFYNTLSHFELSQFESMKRKSLKLPRERDLYSFYYMRVANNIHNKKLSAKPTLYLLDTEDKMMARIYTVLKADNKIDILRPKDFIEVLNNEHNAISSLIDGSIDWSGYTFTKENIEELKKKGKIKIAELEKAEKEYNRRIQSDNVALLEFFDIKKISEVLPTKYQITRNKSNAAKKTEVQLSYREYSFSDSNKNLNYSEHCDTFSLDKKHFKNFILFKARSIASHASSNIPSDILKYLIACFGVNYEIAAASVNYNTMIKLGANTFDDFVNNINDKELRRIKILKSLKNVDSLLFEIYLNKQDLALDEKDLENLKIFDGIVSKTSYENGSLQKSVEIACEPSSNYRYYFEKNNMSKSYDLLDTKIKDLKIDTINNAQSVLDRYPMLKIINIVRNVTAKGEKLDLLNNYLKQIQKNGK